MFRTGPGTSIRARDMSLLLLLLAMEVVVGLLLLVVVWRRKEAAIRGNMALESGDLGPTDCT